MRVDSETGASMEELRRLAGWPDLSPFLDLGSIAFERWLASQVSAGIRELKVSAPKVSDGGFEAVKAGDRARAGREGE